MLMAMRSFLVAYDISGDSARARVSARIQAWGDRIQESVFLCRADEEGRRSLTEQMVDLIDPRTDALMVLPVCESCLASIDAHGQYHEPEQVSCWIVL